MFVATTAIIALLCSAAVTAPAASQASTAASQSPDSQPTTAPAATFEPTTGYDDRQILGWRVRVNHHFVEQHAKTAEQTLELLHDQLYQIVRRLPAAAVAQLRGVTIWVEFREGHHPCLVYHPDAGWLVAHQMNPDKARCVEVADARNFLQWTREQPWMVLHELAHAYHDQILPGGFENADVLDAYHHAMDAKLYDSVLHIFGPHQKAYATTNPQEYFAELTEAYFGTNDFFPFVRAELKEHDPIGFEMLNKAWKD